MITELESLSEMEISRTSLFCLSIAKYNSLGSISWPKLRLRFYWCRRFKVFFRWYK